MQNNDVPKILVDENDCSQAFGLSVSLLRKDRINSQRIPFIKLGKAVRYDLSQVRAALAAFEVGGEK